MNTTEAKFKILPHSVNKKQLFAMYLGQMTERQIREGINTIIADNRNYPPGTPVSIQLVWHIELMEFVSVYGLPKGYKLLKDD